MTDMKLQPQRLQQTNIMTESLELQSLDDRQITHPICVCLRHLLYDFSRGCFGPIPQEKQQAGGPKHPPKSHIAHVLGGHRLDESSGGRLISLAPISGPVRDTATSRNTLSRYYRRDGYRMRFALFSHGIAQVSLRYPSCMGVSHLKNACEVSPKRVPVGTGKRGHYERGLFAGDISRISKISRFSRISRRWSDSPLFFTVWGFSKISRISKFSRISRKWTFLKRPLFQKTPFSDPDPGPRRTVWEESKRSLHRWNRLLIQVRYGVAQEAGGED